MIEFLGRATERFLFTEMVFISLFDFTYRDATKSILDSVSISMQISKKSLFNGSLKSLVLLKWSLLSFFS